MDIAQTPTPQPTSSSTSSTTKNLFLGPGFLAIMIPFICVIVGALLGLAIYLFMRRRRRRSQHSGSGGSATGPGATEEGLNELGEAPPPYELDEARKEQPAVVHVEVSSRPATPDAAPSDQGVVTDAPAEPPPAYIAAMAIARTENGGA